MFTSVKVNQIFDDANTNETNETNTNETNTNETNTNETDRIKTVPSIVPNETNEKNNDWLSSYPPIACKTLWKNKSALRLEQAWKQEQWQYKHDTKQRRYSFKCIGNNLTYVKAKDMLAHLIKYKETARTEIRVTTATNSTTLVSQSKKPQPKQKEKKKNRTTRVSQPKRTTTRTMRNKNKEKKVYKVGDEVSIIYDPNDRKRWNCVVTKVIFNTETKAVNRYDVEGYDNLQPDKIWVYEVETFNVEPPIRNNTDDFRLYYEAKKKIDATHKESNAGDGNDKCGEDVIGSRIKPTLPKTPLKELREEKMFFEPLLGFTYKPAYLEWFHKTYEQIYEELKKNQPELFVHDLTKEEFEEIDKNCEENKVAETKKEKNDELTPTNLEDFSKLLAQASAAMDRPSIMKLMKQRKKFIESISKLPKSKSFSENDSPFISKTSKSFVKVWCCVDTCDSETNPIRRCPHCYDTYGCSEHWSKKFKTNKTCPTCRKNIKRFKNLIPRKNLLKTAISIQSLYRGYRERVELAHGVVCVVVSNKRMKESRCKTNGDGSLGNFGRVAASNQHSKIIFCRRPLVANNLTSQILQPATTVPEQKVESILEEHNQDKKEFGNSILQERNRQKTKLSTTLKKKKQKIADKKRSLKNTNNKSNRTLFTEEESKGEQQQWY